MKDYLIKNKTELTAAIFRGIYLPNPVRRVEIPKDNGQKRQLGIPTVVDRVYSKRLPKYSMGFMSLNSATTATGSDRSATPTKR